MPLSPSISMMNRIHPVPSSISPLALSRANDAGRKRVSRPMIRPMLPQIHIRKSGTLDSVDENSVRRLPPPAKSTKYVQNGKLKIPYSRSHTEDFDKVERRSMSRESSYVSRSPSPALSTSTAHGRSNSSLSNYDTWRSGSMSLSRTVNTEKSSCPPRRMFPQTYSDQDSIDLRDYHKLDQSSVVFDANLSFMLGSPNQRVHQGFHSSPAHSERETASSYLTSKISNFLKRTDHVMEEWSAMGRKKCHGDDTISYIERRRGASMDGGDKVARSKSATNILVRGFQLYNKQPSMRRSFSREPEQLDDDQRTICDEEVKIAWSWMTSAQLLRGYCVTHFC